MLFMLAPRWADDIRRDNAQHRGPWHYINFPFKPDGQPASIQTKPPQAVNIITALVDNERIVNTDTDPARKSIALTWLFHLIGDIHQPLHSVQIFTTDYPNGDQGGNLVCVRPSETGNPINLHRLWDGLLTSSNNVRTLRNMATELRSNAMTNWMNKSIAVLGLSLSFSMGPVLQGISEAQTAPAKDSKTTKSPSAKTSEVTAAPRIVRLPTRKLREWCGLTPPAKFTTKRASFMAKLNVANSCPKTTPKKPGIVKRRPKLHRRQNQRQLTQNKNKFLELSANS